MKPLASVSTRRAEAGTLYFVALLRTELGRRIQTARLAAGLTQRELADRIGIKNASDVSRYERGAVEVPGSRIDLIAEATDRPRSYFTRDPSEPEPATNGTLARLEAELAEVRQSQARMEEMLAAALGKRARRAAPSSG